MRSLVLLISWFMLAGLIEAAVAQSPSRDTCVKRVKHALGMSEVPCSVERIVTIGWGGEDVILALGRVPIAMTSYPQFVSGVAPWNTETTKNVYPAPVSLTGNLDFEQIAALKPGLILATNSGVGNLEYKRLSSIAPTVAYPELPWETGWREQAQIIGDALNANDKAAAIVANTDNSIGQIRSGFSSLINRTITFGTYFPGSSNILIYLPESARMQALSAIGLQPSPLVSKLAASAPNATSISLSLENLDQIDGDILLMWFDRGNRTAFEKIPLVGVAPIVRNGRYLAIDDWEAIWATSSPTAISIPYVYPKLAARISEVLKTEKGVK